MPGLGALWDSLVDCICRPPRDEYSYPEELVGGSRKLFRVGRCPGLREDLTLVNKRGLRLQCSHYLPRHVRGKDGRLPCVIYCHCNSGSRRDAEEAICVLIPQGVSVFALDFAGSGLSEGQWVTLGAEEVDDVACAVEHLRAGGRVSTLGLWGRSMGAVTALLYSQRDPSIAGMVLDSPFARLTDLMLEIVQEQRLPIPRPLARLALAAMRRSVQKRAGFDITKVSPVDAVAQSFIPALFGHATGDTFIRISHAEALFGAYAGDKNLIRFDGDHNSRRPEFFYNSVSIFWHNTLQLEDLLEPADLHQIMTTQAAGAGGSRPAATPRGLRPPPPSNLQPRVRQPLSPLPAAPPASTAASGAGAAAAREGSAREGLARSSSGSELSGAPVTGMAAAAVAAPGTGNAGGGPAAAVVAGPVAGPGPSDGEDEGADVAGPGGAARSAPWEPRLWEMELDRTLLERQRFRRMAGGLPSPPGTAVDPAPGQNRGTFRNSAELANLLSNASDDSVIRRLLGEDPQYSDRVAVSAAAAPLAAAAAAGAAAAGGGGGGLAAGYWLPSSAEEEEAQLRAALELSLLELAANGGSSGGGGGGEGVAAQARRTGSGGGSGGGAAQANGSRPASGAGLQRAQGPPFLAAAAAAAASAGGTGNGTPARPASHEEQVSQQQRQEQQLRVALEGLQQGTGVGGGGQQQGGREGSGGGAGATGRSAPAVPNGPAAAGSGTSSSGGAAAGAAGVPVAGEAICPRGSLIFPAGLTAGPEPRASSLGGRSLSQEDTRAPSVASGIGSAPPPHLGALSGPQHPTEPSIARASHTQMSSSGELLTGALTHAASASLSAPAGATAAAMTVTPATAHGSASRPSVPRSAAQEASLYDLYTEEELLALAVQLSLQESGGGTGAGSDVAASAAASLL